jgi:hypothetical protein
MHVRLMQRSVAAPILSALLCVLGVSAPRAAGNAARVSVEAPGPVYVLRQLTHLRRPSTAPENRVCMAASGDAATVLESAATEASPVYWIRVRFSSGRCAGQEGWIASDAVRVERDAA